MISDSELQASVMAELEWEPRLDAAHIGVSAKDGVITLSGFVDSYAAKAAAEKAARRVKGVRAIAEEITVRLPNDHKRADDEIAGRAIRILDWDVEVPPGTVSIKVERGLVTLHGEVDFQFQREAAENDVRRLSGVTAVVNLIRVKAPLPLAAALDVQDRIERALQRSAEIEAAKITVSVQGHTAILRGPVKSWSERSAVELAAWGAPEITEVRNETYISP
jgi:osmotically-inducible protein OsmY